MMTATKEVLVNLRERIEQSDGLVVIPMGELRSIVGAERLGAHVVESISHTLMSDGYGHLPEILPTDQNERVRVFLLDSKLGRLVQAIQEPNYAGDSMLRRVQVEDKSAMLLEQVKMLVDGSH